MRPYLQPPLAIPCAADGHPLAIPSGRGPLSGYPSPRPEPRDRHPCPSPDRPLTQGMGFPGRSSLTQGMSAQGMTAIPSRCPLLQGMGSKGWHSYPESKPLRQGMGWDRIVCLDVRLDALDAKCRFRLHKGKSCSIHDITAYRTDLHCTAWSTLRDY